MTLNPKHVQAVAAIAPSGCAGCAREILLLEKAFLDERYAMFCVHCMAEAYNLLKTAEYVRDRDIGPGDDPRGLVDDA